LFFVTWREWKFALPPDEARKALRAMFWSTIFCGALALGGFFVVPMAIAAYWQQLRSIRRQEEAALLQASRHFKPSANRFS
jgi:hypothetical protein